MGESFSAQLSTGAGSFTIPIATPAARAGVGASLALGYSTSGGHGLAGVGWDLAVPYISRQTDRGNPRYQDPAPGAAWTPAQDRFVFNGGQELIPIGLVTNGACAGALAGEVMPPWANGWQYFRPRVEGSFLRFFWSPDHRTWRVQDKGGSHMEIGAPLDGSDATGTIEVDPDAPSHVFRWNLSRQYDSHGDVNPAGSTPPAPVNVARFVYLLDGNTSYLSDAYDTSPASNPTTATLSSYAHHVHLNYERRPDATVSYRRGWETSQGLRLVGVDVASKPFVGGASAPRKLVHRYHFAYEPAYHVSLLQSVQVEGRCGAPEAGEAGEPIAEGANELLPPSTPCPRLPAMTFGYTHVAPFHADGSPGQVDLPGYEGFDERLTTMAASPPHAIDEGETDLFDINSDGLPDVLVTMPGLYGNRHGLYLNGVGGAADTFTASTMGIQGILGEDLSTITLQNANVSSGDLDGDGIIDLVHMPQVKTYSVYTPQGSGTSWVWQGRPVTTAAAQSPKINLGGDGLDIQRMDVNGDGLVDVVLSTGTEMETFFALGRYPRGDGQFGHAAWTGPTTADISNDPVATCVPWDGLPIHLSDSTVKVADMNGDGLPDIVRLQQGNVHYWPGRGDGHWGTQGFAACAAGSFGQGTDVAMAGSPQYSDPNGAGLHIDDVNGDGLDDLVQVRFDAVDVWLNVDGAGWTERHVITGAPMTASYLSRTRLVDMNGSGTRDVLWGEAGAYRYMDLSGGARPWMLSHVENGLGKTTDLEYTTSSALQIAASKAKTPWTSFAPMPIHVVSEMLTSDNLAAAGQSPAVYITQYEYRDPVYDGRQREFRGFETAREIHLGDPNNPDSVAESRFLLGQCEDEGDTSGLPSPCTSAGRWRDNPREALKGLPLSSDTLDANGATYLSTAHHTYRLRRLYKGMDGREVRHAFESSSDTYLYDTASGDVAPAKVTLGEVELETAPPAFSVAEIDANPSPSLSVRSGDLLLHGAAGRAHVRHATELDVFGNAYLAIDQGNAGVDEVITSRSQPQYQDATGWLWRTVESKTHGDNDTGPNGFPWRHWTKQTFDSAGSPRLSSAKLEGSLPLVRTNDSGGGVAPPPPTASTDGWITTGNVSYDAFGNAVSLVAPNSRCRATQFEGDFAELPTMDTVFVGEVGSNGCGTTAIATSADYDRGLSAVTRLRDVHEQQTLTETLTGYDGFGRIVAVYRPDPVTGAASKVASSKVEYLLPADAHATPFVRVHTSTQDGAQVTDPEYREAWAYVDGMGRTRVALAEADRAAGDGGDWVGSGIATYDGKGAPERAYQPFFYSGDPSAFPLAAAPTSAYSRVRYDAFGRTIQTFALDGAVSIQTVYHALASDAWDAADLEPGPHQGTYATSIKDGHGRAIATQERAHASGRIEVRQTATTFLSTGEPSVITRSRVGTNDKVVRWIAYDSLGRMVANVEPNTSVAFTPDPTPELNKIRSWRYAYDDNSGLVGTSDARGCGANYGYDAGGRALTEDYSPCTQEQAVYSAAPEVAYAYDAPDADAAAGIPGLAVNARWYWGQLAAVRDRSGKTVKAYDGRRRATGLARRLVGPDGGLAPRWYVQANAYDAADRAVQEITGAVDGGATALDVTTVVTTVYSKRGSVKSVGSDHGSVVDHVIHDSDGLTLEVGYGDTDPGAARTKTSMTYDARRRVRSVQTYRGMASNWSSPPAGYFPEPMPNGPPSSFQMLLEDVDYEYDAVDNPIAIRDYRTPSEWPAGAQPVTRKIQYDDLYRITRVDYQYPAGADPWTSPFAAEETGVGANVNRATPSPHVAFTNRVSWQTFVYDWMGNTTASGDDAAGFYDRSLGAIANGAANAGPYQLKSAANAAGGDGDRSGALSVAYDAAGNMTGIVITRRGPCLPSSGVCSQRFAYDWDEVGRMAHARRWDDVSRGDAGAGASSRPAVELRYAYDATDERAIKAAYNNAGAVHFALYPLGALELRGTQWDGEHEDYARDPTTQVPYVIANGRRVGRIGYDGEQYPGLTSGGSHLLLELTDHLGSTNIIFDRSTSELVEASSYLAYGAEETDYRANRWNGFREDYRFTGKEEDAEVGLQYFGARYYSASLGRWTSADPLSVHTCSADLNLYAYVHGAPLRATDSRGLAEDDAKGVSFQATKEGSAATEAVNATYTAPDGAVASVGPAISPAPAPEVAGQSSRFTPDPTPSLGEIADRLAQFDRMPSARPGPAPSVYNPDAFGLVAQTAPPTKIYTPTEAQKQDDAVRAFVSLALMAAPFMAAETAAVDAAPALCPCFSADTLVATEHGLQPIADVREGDLIWSAEPETGERALRRVVRRYATPSKALVEIAVDGPRGTEFIRATPGHPFWVDGKGWTHAGALDIGEQLHTDNGEIARIVGGYSVEQPETVYNFEVERWHTYFVGAYHALVHNGCVECTSTVADVAAPAVDELVPSLRPDRALGSTPHPFEGIPKALHPEVFDIVSDLQASRAGDAAAAARLATRTPHVLTGDLKGWTSLDIAGRSNPLRFLYKEAPDGIKWMVRNTH